MSEGAPLFLPVGFQRFHRSRFIDYQLNRAHSLGWADAADLHCGAAQLRRRADLPGVFETVAEEAAGHGRHRAAAGSMRIAEFFTAGSDPVKVERYRRFRELVDLGVPALASARVEIDYRDGFLPCYRLPGCGRGTVLVHGGFDSLIEEFLGIWQRIAAAGFDVIAFDGPGQGGARRLAGLPFEHDWERPVAAVLDRFELDRASLVGMSMGGHWALRAAAYEERIDRVVCWPPVYDWLLRVPAVVRPATRWMLGRRRFMRWSIRTRARLVPTLATVVDQALYIMDATDPVAVVDWFLAMNPRQVASERITQDVLVLIGEHDRFQPPQLARAQIAALTNARSVTTRIFTTAEQADQHCQLGNLSLAVQVLLDWLEG